MSKPKPSMDQMRLALTKGMPRAEREANKAKFLHGSHEKGVMYHGTNADFKDFKPSQRGAYFVSPDPSFANSYIGKYTNYGELEPNGQNIMPVHVQAKLPFDYDNPAHLDNLYDEYAAIKGRPLSSGVKDAISQGYWAELENPDVMKAIKNLGHDSMYVAEHNDKNKLVKNLALFHPTQIKSATGNRGTYDPTDPDITKAKGGSVMGINVKSDTKAGRSYADLIVDGHKKYESRNADSLRPYVGKRVAIVRTGEGKAKAIGEVTIGEPMVVDKNKFRAMEEHHHVPESSAFDINTPTKHLYPMHNPVRYDQEKDVGHGIVSRKVIHKAQGGNVKYPSIEEMLQKLREAGRTPIVPAPNRWFADAEKHPFQQKMIEKVLAQTGQGREGFPSGSYINPQTGEPMDFEIMHDLGVAIDPSTGRPMMSGIRSDLTEIDPKLGSITKSNLVRKGLFKHEGGDELLKDLAFLATIEKSGKGHHYGLSTEYASPAELVNTMTGANPTLRPHSRGDIFGVGEEVGRISIQGKHHPVYEKLLVAPTGSHVQGKKLHKAKGGQVTHAHHLEIEERPL